MKNYLGLSLAVALLCNLTCSGGSKSGGSGGQGGTDTGGSGGTPTGGGGGGSGGGSGGTTGGSGGGTGGATGGSGGATGGTGGTPTGGTGGTPTGGTGGTGGTPTGGTGGTPTGGTGGTPTGGAGGSLPPPPTGASVLERNRNPTRDGHFVQPTLTRAAAAKMVNQATFKTTFTGKVYGSPLYLENGPGGKGVVFTVTTNNDVFAFDETTGATVWTKNLGTPASNNGPNAPCGTIHPLGILSTPVIDAQARTIFVGAAVGNASAILRHEVHALSVDDGSERGGWPVDVGKAVGFDPQPHNQRSALSLVKGIVYVAYGGHNGDCGDYHGRVVAIDSRDPSKVTGWVTGGRGEAIWAPGGMASDGEGVFAVTGNRTGGGTTVHLDSEQVARIRGMASLNRGVDDVFFPSVWQEMDRQDADFGSSSPVVVQVPGATPSIMVAATAKTGHVYFLDARRLGGMGGQLVDFVAGSSGFTAPAAYPTTKGIFMAFMLGSGRCPAGQGGNLVGVRLAPGAPVQPEVVWCAPSAGSRSPIATTTDGRSEAVVWFMNGDKLNAVDGETGQVLFNGGPFSCYGTNYWTSPIAVKGRIIVAATDRVCSWAPGP